MFRNFGEGGFAEALDLKERRTMQFTTAVISFSRAFSAPIVSPFVFYRLKKGKGIFGCAFLWVLPKHQQRGDGYCDNYCDYCDDYVGH
jgi:hypothetical protein